MPKLNRSNRYVLIVLLLAPLMRAQSTSNLLDNLPFPRIGNIWTGNYWFQTDPSHANQIGLYLGPDSLTPQSASVIRAANPSVLMLTDINVTDTAGATSLPDSYYMRDVNGNMIEDWCATSPRYMLNMTLPQVSTYLAQYAAQAVASSGGEFNGAFFDSFATTVPQPYTDCWEGCTKSTPTGTAFRTIPPL